MRAVWLALGALLALSCGIKGPPRPPSVAVPVSVSVPDAGCFACREGVPAP